MTPQLGAAAILDLWAANRAQRLTKRGTCAGCDHLLHLPESRTARCAHEGLRKISDAYIDGDARPSWCGFEQKEKA
jgi:hypothetical protein